MATLPPKLKRREKGSGKELLALAGDVIDTIWLRKSKKRLRIELR
jgi:hypothetical protein